MGTLEKCGDSDDTERIVSCSAAGTSLVACPPACANGDVLLEQDGTPKILWGDVWSPICGHYFWDNQVGATKFCQKLGYGKGAQSGSGSGNHYTTDSFRLGSCQEGDELTGCTGGCNDYVVGGQCSNSGIFSSDECTQGDANAMTIHCIEPSNTVFNPSCTTYKQLGEWANEGGCDATGDDKTCGPGAQKQTRDCIDGVSNKCTDADISRTVSCNDAGTALPDCVVEKVLGEWTNDGACVGTEDNPTCGPGTQNQVRTCTDGSTDVCTDADTAQTISCALPDCVVEKVLGEWTNDGDCVATGDDPACGPGTQNQVRTCTDGSTDVCTDADTAQAIACALPDCVVEKVLGDWTNDGDCVATGDDPTCGPGNQNQVRTCTDGSTDVCTDADTAQNIACALPDCVVEKVLGDWTNDGDCVGTGDDPTCGPGTQSQVRTCTDGSVDVCTDADTAQSISCTDAGTALPECAAAPAEGGKK